MTEYTELKPLLEACRAENCDGPREFRKAVEALFDVCTVETISALISENDQLAKTADCWDRLNVQNKALSDSFRAERDQLKAENETLRSALKAAEDAMWHADGNMDGEAADARDALASAGKGESS